MKVKVKGRVKDQVKERARAMTMTMTSAMERPASLAVLVMDEGRCPWIVLDGEEIRLRRGDWNLLRELARRPGRVVGYETLYRALFATLEPEITEIHTRKRKLLERIGGRLPARAGVVEAVRGVGLRLVLQGWEVEVVKKGKGETRRAI